MGIRQHILLIRHGQTDANVNGIAQGHQPTTLNRIGQSQAVSLARRLAAFEPRIDLLISSDLPRAVQTASPVAEALGLSISYRRSWRERCYGSFEGLGREERARLRRQLGIGESDPPGAQTIEEYQLAIRETFLALSIPRPQAACIAVVTHAGACRAVAMMLADGRLPSTADKPVLADFTCPNAAITHLICTITPSGPLYRYESVFDVTHLEPAGITTADWG